MMSRKSLTSIVMEFGLVAMLICLATSVAGDNICPNSGTVHGCTCKERTGSSNPSIVTCDHTDLTTIPGDLPKAEEMRFYNNSFTILASVEYRYMTTLRLHGNQLTEIRDNAFSGAPKLTNLDIGREKIVEYLTPNTFAGLEHLMFITVKDTRLHVIQAGVFGEAVPNLQELKLVNCSIFRIYDNAFSNSQHLNLIDLSHNELQSIPRFTTNESLSELHTLILSHNAITNLQHLSRMPALRSLILQNNALTQIAGDAFKNIAATIEFIDLTNNRISTIATVTFIGLSQLSDLELTNNSLTHVIWEELPWDDHLERIGLAQNPWSCSCHNKFLIEDDKVELYNHEKDTQWNLRCGSPKKVKGKIMYDISPSYFECGHKSETSSSSQARSGVVIAITVLAVVCLIALGMYVFSKMRKWKREKRNRDNYFSTSLRDGILREEYSDQNFSTNLEDAESRSVSTSAKW